jgi:hypothetical protein
VVQKLPWLATLLTQLLFFSFSSLPVLGISI